MHEFGILRDLALIFAVAVLVVAGLRRLQVPAIAGYIASGVVVGPGVLGLIHEMHEVEILAEVGVVLLLFGIGLELSFDRIRRLWKAILVGGVLQVAATGAAATGLALLWGWEVGPSIYFGCLMAVSSTAVVLRGLTQRGELDAPHGRVAVGILIFQDLCVVPMMLAIPFLAGQGDRRDALAALGLAVLVLVTVLVAARILVPRLLRLVARSRQRDLFVLTVALACFGTAYAVTGAGISLALGAFLGGLVVAGSEYRHQAMADLLPLREALSSVFFVSIGMLLDLRAIAADAGPILFLFLLILLGKFVIVFLTAAAMRLPLRVCVLTGAALAQVGEFSFVLMKSAEGTGLVPDDLANPLLVAIILSMAVTPVFLAMGPHIAAGASRVPLLDRMLRVASPAEARSPEGRRDHIIIAGFGLAGEMVSRVLQQDGRRFVIVDINPHNVRRAVAEGHNAFYGDVTSAEVLEHLDIQHARGLVLAVNDTGATRRAVRAARQQAPGVNILARALYAGDGEELVALGANQVVINEETAARELGKVVLATCCPAATATDPQKTEGRQE